MIAYLWSAQAEDVVSCDRIHDLIGGELEPWLDDGAGYGYWPWPADVRAVGHINFTLGGVVEYRAKSARDVHWVIWFRTYEAGADSQGEHFGQHDFCGPYRLTDPAP